MLKKAPTVILSDFIHASADARRLTALAHEAADAASKAKAAAGRAKQALHFASLSLAKAKAVLRSRIEFPIPTDSDADRAGFAEILRKCEEAEKGA